MTYSFVEEAQHELEDTIRYYERKQEGLGEEFAYEIRIAIDNILRHPEAWSRLSEGVWRCRTDRFPYGVVYTKEGEEILILAIMHLRQKPGYWQDRMP